MLVVVHDGDVQRSLQSFFNGKAFWSLDVFEVDTSEGRRNLLYRFAELVGVFLVHLDVEDVDAAIDFEKQSLALHHGLSAHGADVAQSEHGSTVGDDGNQITLVGVFVNIVWILLDFQTRISHSRRVGQREVGLRTIRFGGFYLDFTRFAGIVIFQCGFFSYFYHCIYF